MIQGVVLVQVARKHSMRRLLVSVLLKIRPRVSSRQLRARDSHPNLQTCSLKLTHPMGVVIRLLVAGIVVRSCRDSPAITCDAPLSS